MTTCAVVDCNNPQSASLLCEHHLNLLFPTDGTVPTDITLRLDIGKMGVKGEDLSRRITRPCAIRTCKNYAKWQVTSLEDSTGIRVCDDHRNQFFPPAFTDHWATVYTVTPMPQTLADAERSRQT